ncbi:hypothetical protein ACP70R_029897 [Stipagrostis hirtigluma subsp. patula]
MSSMPPGIKIYAASTRRSSSDAAAFTAPVTIAQRPAPGQALHVGVQGEGRATATPPHQVNAASEVQEIIPATEEVIVRDTESVCSTGKASKYRRMKRMWKKVGSVFQCFAPRHAKAELPKCQLSDDEVDSKEGRYHIA